MKKLNWNKLEKSLFFLIIIFLVVMVLWGAFNFVFNVLLAPQVPENVSVEVVERNLNVKKVVNYSLVGIAGILFIIIVVLLIALLLKHRREKKSVPEFDVFGMQKGFE